MNFSVMLERNIQVQLTILDNLYRSQVTCTLEELSKTAHCDKRSVLHHCDYLKVLSDDHITKSTKGFTFSGTISEYQLLLLKILEHSAIFQLLKDLCLQPRVDLVSFATEQKISIPSLRRHLTRINQLLTTYQLQLKTSKGFVYLKGSEPQVRYLIYLFLWQYYQGVVWPFPTVDFHETFAGIEYAFQLTKQKPNKLKMIEWCFIIAITFVRSAQGNQMNQRELPDFTEEIWDSFEEITHFLKRMSVKAKLDLLEVQFLFLWLQARPAFYLKDDHLERAMKFHLKKATAIKQFQNSFYSYIYEIGFKSTQINVKKKLLNSTIFANGMSGLLFHRFSTIKYDLSVFVEENYPAFNREINQLASQFQKQQQELYWVQSCHLIEAFMIITSPTYFDKEIKIKYESDLPLSIELSYMSMLQEQLRVYLNVVFTNDLLFEPDLIIRTTDMPLKILTYEETIPCLVAPTDMSSEQIYLLSQKIKKLVNE